nr:hypothetical protein [uncultured archaeon]
MILNIELYSVTTSDGPIHQAYLGPLRPCIFAMSTRTQGQKNPSRTAMRTLFNLALGVLASHLGALVDGRTSRNAVYSSEALMRCLIRISARGPMRSPGWGFSGTGAIARRPRTPCSRG